MGPGGAGYGWSKRVLVQYVEQMALQLASRFIRDNAKHPTNCNTHLVHNEALYTLFRPDIAGAGQPVSREDAELAFTAYQALPDHSIEHAAGPHLANFLPSTQSRSGPDQPLTPQERPT